MENVINPALTGSRTKTILFDILAVLFIYFVPVFSHLTALPIYYFEPMRILMILALIHTSKRNAFILALTLPAFSFVVSAHPSLIKAGLITLELLLNVVFFFWFTTFIKERFVNITLSIIASKIIYYLLKYVLISTALLGTGLISTPFYFQIIVIMLLTFYVLGFDKLKKA